MTKTVIGKRCPFCERLVKTDAATCGRQQCLAKHAVHAQARSTRKR